MDIETYLYEKLCRGCPHEKQCLKEKEHCENYLEELDREIAEQCI